MSAVATATMAPPLPTTPASATTAQSADQTFPPTSNASQNPNISPAEIRFVTDGCSANLRCDGRSTTDYRPYALTSSSGGPSSAAASPSTVNPPLVLSNGSSRLTLPGSDTDILCSVRAELVCPAPARPSEGVVELNVDLLGSSDGGGGGDNQRQRRTEEMELTSILSHLFVPHVVDLAGLCVIPGRYVWRLAVDVLVVQCDGNLLDCCGMAIGSAVRGTVLPVVTPVAKAGGAEVGGGAGAGGGGGGGGGGARASDDFVVDGDVAKAVAPAGSEDCPVVVTVYVLNKGGGSGGGNRKSRGGGSVLIVDARSEEEACASSRISVGVDPKGRICGVHKYGSSAASSLGDCGGDGNVRGSSLPMGLLADVTGLAVASSRKVLEMVEGSPSGGGRAGSMDDGVGGGSDDLLLPHFEIR